ncbi:hypothetical protein H696_00140 [Fonticula alba]|uniref:MAGE domain-containing protein n=1 Tax=Fonticula alba TaxID=691883 RepID=A0A058ZDW1_FONAL|nr:hypothetical protein H696_00140 [Fonticula alba]KCV72549.1 hypothetical protein H696_00140 [Fonticula alba]|eukprot:XP_009492250.1 hypothetical protein H696_00140 [Fonticula alba]
MSSAPAANASFANRARAFINHPAGPLTIHFWAPAAKWVLVLAGIRDINRPAENLSMLQSAGLASTGFIWARYSTQITPINYSLMVVNLFVGFTGLYQVVRILKASWARYSTQITPINYSLMVVNLFVGFTGLYQVVRILKCVMPSCRLPRSTADMCVAHARAALFDAFGPDLVPVPMDNTQADEPMTQGTQRSTQGSQSGAPSTTKQATFILRSVVNPPFRLSLLLGRRDPYASAPPTPSLPQSEALSKTDARLAVWPAIPAPTPDHPPPRRPAGDVSPALAGLGHLVCLFILLRSGTPVTFTEILAYLTRLGIGVPSDTTGLPSLASASDQGGEDHHTGPAGPTHPELGSLEVALQQLVDARYLAPLRGRAAAQHQALSQMAAGQAASSGGGTSASGESSVRYYVWGPRALGTLCPRRMLAFAGRIVGGAHQSTGRPLGASPTQLDTPSGPGTPSHAAPSDDVDMDSVGDDGSEGGSSSNSPEINRIRVTSTRESLRPVSTQHDARPATEDPYHAAIDPMDTSRVGPEILEASDRLYRAWPFSLAGRLPNPAPFRFQ